MAEVSAESLFEELDLVVDGPNMAIGSPSPDVLKKCPALLKEAAIARMDEESAYSLFQYGSRYGDPRFRRSLAAFLTERYGQPVMASSLIPTGGATAGLGMLTNYFFSKGDIVFVEDLTYFLALIYFRNDVGLRIVSVPTDDGGLVPEALERAIETHASEFRESTSERPFRAGVYVIPTFHNPTGRNLLPARCGRLVEIARRHKLLVMSDDVYNLLPLSVGSVNPDTITPARLLVYDDIADPESQGNVVSIGTFSKIFGPGVRLGWLEGPAHILGPIRRSAYLNSGGAVQQLLAGIVASVLESGKLGSLLDETRQALEVQATAMCQALDTNLPTAASYTVPSGGFFVWVTLPQDVDAEVLARRLYREKITVKAGVQFSPDGGYKNCVRLSFSFSPPEVLQAGVKRMCEVVREIIEVSQA